ncbi:hypothetical protein THRCLA_03146 [Thraustotheca clavata]|uniref:Uncharacterized protein n=1 Tax=Thraustotheca clavata TaxID=74557 RepID=A0A1W0A3L8_9STRA|nr:hypothetical protein THRCLA_03146 [Thraustotheca clavata]
MASCHFSCSYTTHKSDISGEYSKTIQVISNTSSYNVIICLLGIVNALYNSIKSPECPKGCLVATHPWFSRSCECAYFKLECQDAIDFTTILTHDYLGSHFSFFALRGVRCLKVLIYLIYFHSKVILNLQLNFLTWLKEIGLSLYSNLSAIPEALLHLPPNCKVLTIAQSLNISTLPNAVKDAWSTLSRVVLDNNQFFNIPKWIDKLTTLERLVLSSNALKSTLEAAIAKLSVLTHFEIAQIIFIIFQLLPHYWKSGPMQQLGSSESCFWMVIPFAKQHLLAYKLVHVSARIFSLGIKFVI